MAGMIEGWQGGGGRAAGDGGREALRLKREGTSPEFAMPLKEQIFG